LPTYEGKKLFSAYRKRYGVDWLPTFHELGMLGIAIEPAYKEQVLRAAQCELIFGDLDAVLFRCSFNA